MALIRFPDSTVVLAPQYFGTAAYYNALSVFPRVVIDTRLRYDKRFKSIHRCRIASTRGEMTLTVPVARPAGASRWDQVRVSSHGQWWAQHLTALESAYGRTPYFEFYADRLAPILAWRDISVTDLCLEADAACREMLGITSTVLPPEALAELDPATVVDMRRGADFAPFEPRPYYQQRALALGFIPGLSVLDIIFNLGPEAPLFFLPKP